MIFILQPPKIHHQIPCTGNYCSSYHMHTDLGIFGTHLDECAALMHRWEATTTAVCPDAYSSPPRALSAALTGAPFLPHPPHPTHVLWWVDPTCECLLLHYTPSRPTKPAHGTCGRSRTFYANDSVTRI